MRCLVSVILASTFFFFFNDTATTEIYTLSLHDALPISGSGTPTRSSNTGPYRVHHSVRVTFRSEPSGCRAITETVRGSIGVGWPSWRYWVGWPGTSVSWYGVNR